MNLERFIDASPWITVFEKILFLVIFFMCIAVLSTVLQKRKYRKQKATLKDWVFESSYVLSVRRMYPHLSEADIQKAFEQLRIYFFVCWSQSSNRVAMPSKIVDAIWHVFILDTRSYLKFCDTVFGSYLHHEPPAQLSSKEIMQMNEQIYPWLPMVRAYQGARICEAEWYSDVSYISDAHLTKTRDGVNLDVTPMLFMIDEALRIENGFCYKDEFLQGLAKFDLKSAEFEAARQNSSGGGLAASCGDGGSCGCGGSV